MPLTFIQLAKAEAFRRFMSLPSVDMPVPDGLDMRLEPSGDLAVGGAGDLQVRVCGTEVNTRAQRRRYRTATCYVSPSQKPRRSGRA